MRLFALLLATTMLSVAGGCRTHLALRDSTLNTANTLADLNYEQVLDNLARFEKNPGAMPSLAVINAGTVNVADQKSFNANATVAPTITAAQQAGSGLPILSLLFNPNAQRNLSENWSLAPVTDIDNLRRIRCAYQLLVNAETSRECIDCQDLLRRFYEGEQDNLDCVIPRGWYEIGCEKEVPKCACYVGHYCDLYVWVRPDGLDGLTRFTMTVIDLRRASRTRQQKRCSGRIKQMARWTAPKSRRRKSTPKRSPNGGKTMNPWSGRGNSSARPR